MDHQCGIVGGPAHAENESKMADGRHFGHWGPENPCKYEKRNIWLKCSRIAKIPAPYRKFGSGNTMVTSDFWSQVEIWPFRACAIKKYAIWPLLVAESPMNSAMGQIPCSTERISCLINGYFLRFPKLHNPTELTRLKSSTTQTSLSSSFMWYWT